MTMTAISTQMRIVEVSHDMREERQNAIRSAWAFTHAALFRSEQFTDKEVLNFQYLIGEHFEPSVSAEKNYIRFCVRVMLAKRYAELNKNYRFPRPALWLNKNYDGGFVNTKSWYERLIEKRKLVGAYAQPLFVLVNGTFKYAQSPNSVLFNLYREKLIHLKAYNCLNVFYNATLFMNHINH